MAINKRNLFLLIPVPLVLFIMGVLENQGLAGNSLLLEYTIIPVSLVAFVIYIYRQSTAFFYTSGMVFYYYIGMSISLLLISAGMEMVEINKTGTPNGSAFIVLATFIYSVSVSKIAFEWASSGRRVIKAPVLPSGLVNLLLLLTLSGVLLLGAFILLVYHGPVLTQQNRVAFWESMDSTGLSFYPSLVIQSFYFCAYYYLYCKCYKSREKKAIFFLIGYFLVTLLILGQKFSAFIIYGAMFFSLLPAFSKNIKIKLKHFLIGFFTVGIITIIIVLNYNSQGYDNTFIFSRVALQGQLMWSVFDHSFPDFLGNRLGCFTGCYDFESGKDMMSYNYLPFSTYSNYISSGTELSGFSPALQFWFLGIFFTVILQTLVSFIMGYIQAKMLTYNRENNFVVGFLLFKLNFTLFLIWHVLMFSALLGAVITLLILVLYFLSSLSSRLRNVKDDGSHAT